MRLVGSAPSASKSARVFRLTCLRSLFTQKKSVSSGDRGGNSIAFNRTVSSRPFLSCKIPHFQTEAKCKISLFKMSFICTKVKIKSFFYYFYITGLALSLALEEKHHEDPQAIFFCDQHDFAGDMTRGCPTGFKGSGIRLTVGRDPVC